VQRLQDLLALL